MQREFRVEQGEGVLDASVSESGLLPEQLSCRLQG
jgi:hypothetical protein